MPELLRRVSPNSCTANRWPSARCPSIDPSAAGSALPAEPAAPRRGRSNDGSAAGVRELWGWRHPPEGHRAGSRPRDARGQEQPSRSSEPSDHRLLCDGWAQGDGAGSGGADTIVTGKRPASPSGAGPAWPVLWNLTSRPVTVSSGLSKSLR